MLKNCNVGLINKGNTCYINSSLQCLSTTSLFCSTLTCQSNQLSPFVASFAKIISLLNLSRSTLSPSQFLRFLREVFFRSGKQHIHLFKQKDASEILPVNLNELCDESLNTFDLLKTLRINTITCSMFLQMYRKRGSSDNIITSCFKFSLIFHRSFPEVRTYNIREQVSL